MTVILNGAELTSRRALHDFLQQALSLPDYYGRNLDALYDCLTDLREPVALRVTVPDKLADNLGFYANSLLLVLRRSAQENELLTVTVEEPEPTDPVL